MVAVLLAVLQPLHVLLVVAQASKGSVMCEMSWDRRNLQCWHTSRAVSKLRRGSVTRPYAQCVQEQQDMRMHCYMKGHAFRCMTIG